MDQRPDAVGAHKLRAVQQRKALFRLQPDRLQPQFGKHFGRGTHLALILHLAQPQQRQAHMCQRREVARSAQRTLLIDDGQDAAVEKLHETLHRRQLHARMAVGERLYLEQQNQPHDLRGHALPGSAGVRHHEVLLQARQLVAAHRNVAQRPETGRDAVDRPLGVLHLAVEVLAAADDARPGVVAQRERQPPFEDFADAPDRKVLRGDMVMFHG